MLHIPKIDIHAETLDEALEELKRVLSEKFIEAEAKAERKNASSNKNNIRENEDSVIPTSNISKNKNSNYNIVYKFYQALLNGPLLLASAKFQSLIEETYKLSSIQINEQRFITPIEGLSGEYFRYKDGFTNTILGGNEISFSHEVHLSGTSFNAWFYHLKRHSESHTKIDNISFLKSKNGEPYTDIHGQSGFFVSLNSGGKTIILVNVHSLQILNQLEEDFRNKYLKELKRLMNSDKIVEKLYKLKQENLQLINMHNEVYKRVDVSNDPYIKETKIIINQKLKSEYDLKSKEYLRKVKAFKEEQKEAINTRKKKLNDTIN